MLIPSLLLSGIPPQTALGTNKFAAVCGMSTALINYMKAGKVIRKIAAFDVAFSLVGSVIGTRAILYFSQDATAKIILLLLPVTAVLTFLPKKQLKTSITEFSKKDLHAFVPLLCFAIGVYYGFFGAGTCTFLIFRFYVFLGLHLVQASAVSKVFNIASNLGSVVAFALAGKILYGLAIPMALSNMAGGYLGSKLAIRRGQEFIRVFLLIVFAILFATLLFRIWKGPGGTSP